MKHLNATLEVLVHNLPSSWWNSQDLFLGLTNTEGLWQTVISTALISDLFVWLLTAHQHRPNTAYCQEMVENKSVAVSKMQNVNDLELCQEISDNT